MPGLSHADELGTCVGHGRTRGPVAGGIGPERSVLSDSVAVLPVREDGSLGEATDVKKTTGGLRFTGRYTVVGNPSCIVFLDLAAAG